MSYSQARELTKQELQREGLDANQYGLHSMLSGGALAALSLWVTVPDRLVQWQGGWRSEKSLTNYIEESLDSLLLVIKVFWSELGRN